MKNIKTEANYEKQPLNREDAQKDLRIQQAKDNEMVRGRFRYFELPGGAIEFVFKVYKGQEVERYYLADGEIYTIPLGVARHLNKNCWYPEYNYAPQLAGEKTQTIMARVPNQGRSTNSTVAMKVTKKVQRMGFESLEFMDVEDVAPMASHIVTVENI